MHLLKILFLPQIPQTRRYLLVAHIHEHLNAWTLIHFARQHNKYSSADPILCYVSMGKIDIQ